MDSSLRHVPSGPAPVVVGVDGSADSLHALVWAASEAADRRVPLQIVHAWTVPAVAFTTPVVPPAFIDPTTFEVGAEQVVAEAAEAVRARLGGSSPDLVTTVVAGDPTGVLLDVAHHAALLVVGSHGRGAVARTVLGSVAERCLADAEVPVVVVRHDVVPAPDGPVVVGIDDSEDAREALRWAVREAGRLGRRLQVVHAHDIGSHLRPDLATPPVLDDTALRSVRRFLDHLLIEVAVIGGRPRSVSWQIAVGHPAATLVEAASGAAMLVLGSPHPHGIVEHLVGSTGRHCVREARCPVVVVPGPSHLTTGTPALECAS